MRMLIVSTNPSTASKSILISSLLHLRKWTIIIQVFSCTSDLAPCIHRYNLLHTTLEENFGIKHTVVMLDVYLPEDESAKNLAKAVAMRVT